MKHSKEESRRRAVESILSEMRQSFVVVEGRHDLAVMQRLRVRAQTYERVMRSGLPLPEQILVFTDNDRRGAEKAQRLDAFLTEQGVRVDGVTGTRLLKLLNITHVEGILQPIQQALGAATMRTRTKKQKTIGEIYGENILGHSKVHGRSKVLDQRHG